ncbi:hypothetical protein ABZY05_49565 [Streptomyces canus]|uniref:hypothetical protein n=1 Tax=Streptomyces canus TaxID=58343 RepID=UPI0033A5D14C
MNHSAGYRVISDVSEVADQTYEYGIVTLDGASSYSVEGTTLLNHLGDAVRGSSATVVIGGNVVPRDRPAGRPRWASAPVIPLDHDIPGQSGGQLQLALDEMADQVHDGCFVRQRGPFRTPDRATRRGAFARHPRDHVGGQAVHVVDTS